MKQLCAVVFLLVISSFSQASIMSYEVSLSGANEVPINASTGTGMAIIKFDDTLKTMALDISFANLLGFTTSAHIHAATALPFTGNAGVATKTPTFLGFPSGVKAGHYLAVFDMTLASSYNAPFIVNNGGTTASAFLALEKAAFNGQAYLNIHSTAFPGGEIRGFLKPRTAVPEPSLFLLMLVGCMALVFRRVRLN